MVRNTDCEEMAEVFQGLLPGIVSNLKVQYLEKFLANSSRMAAPFSCV